MRVRFSMGPWLPGLCALALLLLAACGGEAKKAPAELERGVAVVRYFASAKYLNMSMYSATVEDHKPSELISYLFSSMGAAEWPPDEGAGEMSTEQARATRTPLVPGNVRLRPLAPDNAPGLQLVLRPDDARRLIIVDGYTAPNKPPVSTTEVPVADIRRPKR